MKVEDLKCFEIDGGEIEHVIAKSEEDAIKYYLDLTGFELEELEIKELKEWYNIPLKIETHKGWEQITFLECARDGYDSETFEPYIIASTAY